ncbi:MBL fold metallo-hydrolase [Streptococcus entericus]|uniref:MBL fold metallo-hydrolase n=1 Tax=Streptococcus entericus TaxID=155680 RepID=UPI00037E1554|nr:MBL fold metallo-hydrolase [Streptococcus entericus]
MQFQHLRQSTARLTYAGKTFLIDPMLAEKGAYPAFDGAVTGNTQNNPLVDLPLSLVELTAGIDAVIITHLHIDHWDPVAAEVLDKALPIFVQNEADATVIAEAGFTDVRVLTEDTSFESISLHKTDGVHVEDMSQLSPDMQTLIGSVCGVVFQTEGEQTLYLAGDTLWNDDVKTAINRYQPEVIVLNAGGNALEGFGRVVMDKADVLAVARHSEAQLIAVHMEAVNHWALSRQELATFAEQHGFADRLHIPQDGEIIIL